MKQKCEHVSMYFLIIYILKLTYNDKYILLYLVIKIKTSRVSNTTCLIRQIQLLTNIL